MIGTAGSEDKAKLAREAGAHHTILYRSEDWVARVQARSPAASCARLSMTASARRLSRARWIACGPSGSFISFGSASGPIEAFNIGLLAQKGSLYAQRPTLFAYIGR